MTEITHWVQLVFHAIPIFLAIRVWIEHENWRKDVKEKTAKQYSEQNNKMSFTTLKLLLFITIYLSLDTFFTLHNIQQDSEKSSKNSEVLLSVVSKIDEIKRNTDISLVCSQFPDIDSIKNRFPPILAETFSSYIEENAAFFKDGIHDGKVSFQVDRFEKAYVKILEYLVANYKPKTHGLYATSLASTKYFWTSSGNLRLTENEMKKYIQKGGYVKRVFFLDDNWESDSVADSILNRQIDSIGVDVWYIPWKYNTYGNLFVVNREREFAWELIIDNSEEIKRGTYFTKKSNIINYMKIFQDLESNHEIRKYTKE